MTEDLNPYEKLKRNFEEHKAYHDREMDSLTFTIKNLRRENGDLLTTKFANEHIINTLGRVGIQLENEIESLKSELYNSNRKETSQ